ncbi:unnamed protein product [Linum trigynum]|uniref:Uncharacterized protein n=1 Tax=Linum trigynum TaxID=586398 RepID=A0AAV2EUD0_9ROSI
MGQRKRRAGAQSRRTGQAGSWGLAMGQRKRRAGAQGRRTGQLAGAAQMVMLLQRACARGGPYRRSRRGCHMKWNGSNGGSCVYDPWGHEGRRCRRVRQIARKRIFNKVNMTG